MGRGDKVPGRKRKASYGIWGSTSEDQRSTWSKASERATTQEVEVDEDGVALPWEGESGTFTNVHKLLSQEAVIPFNMGQRSPREGCESGTV